MFIIEYISHRFQGEERENEHQYVTEHPKEHYDIYPQDLRVELRNFYSKTAYSTAVKKSVRFAFLDFHRRKYQGEDMDFMDFVKTSPSRVSHENVDEWIHFCLIPENEERLREWVELRENEGKRHQLLSEEHDTRIKGKQSADYIKSYFLDKFCNTKDRTGAPYFCEKDVLHFLRANFIDFEPRSEVIKLKSKAYKAQAHIRRTVYAFYISHTTENSKEKRRYCELLRDNFHEFDNSDFEETIMKSFSKK